MDFSLFIVPFIIKIILEVAPPDILAVFTDRMKTLKNSKGRRLSQSALQFATILSYFSLYNKTHRIPCT